MKRKKLRLFLLAGLVALLGAGGTVAYLAATPDPVENTFTPGKVSCEVIETFTGTGTKSNVKIKNTGNIDAYVRADVVFNWVDKDRKVYSKATPVKDTGYTISYNTTNNVWKQSGGYWYCTSPVASGDETPVLITSCTETNPPTGYHLQVTILAEAIQAKGTDGTDPAVTNAWDVPVVDGALSVS